MLAFTIPGPAVPKQRPRVTFKNGRPLTFTPAETRRFERDVGYIAKAAGAKPHQGIVCLIIRFYGLRGDGDNALKSLCDALNGIAWNDDRQVEEYHIYVERKGKPARTEVEIRTKGAAEIGCCSSCGLPTERAS